MSSFEHPGAALFVLQSGGLARRILESVKDESGAAKEEEGLREAIQGLSLAHPSGPSVEAAERVRALLNNMLRSRVAFVKRLGPEREAARRGLDEDLRSIAQSPLEQQQAGAFGAASQRRVSRLSELMEGQRKEVAAALKDISEALDRIKADERDRFAAFAARSLDRHRSPVSV